LPFFGRSGSCSLPKLPVKQKIFFGKLEAEDVTIEKLLKWTPQLEDNWVDQQLGLTKGKRQDPFELIDKWKGKTYLRR
jgi:hypothetical protein